MANRGTALIFDAGIELPPEVMHDNMFVIPRRVHIGDEVILLDRTRTAAGFLPAPLNKSVKYLPLRGGDIRTTLLKAADSFSSALLVQSRTAALQTSQSMKLAARSLFGEAAQIIRADTESVAFVSALQLVARPAQTLSAFEVGALFSALHRRTPTWFYAPYGNSRSFFASGNAVVERAQINDEPAQARLTLADEDAVVDTIAEGIMQAVTSPGQIVFIRQAGCTELVTGLKGTLAEKMGEAFATLLVKSAESRSTTLAARFGSKFIEVALLEPTQNLIDFTNDAADIMRRNS